MAPHITIGLIVTNVIVASGYSMTLNLTKEVETYLTNKYGDKLLSYGLTSSYKFWNDWNVRGLWNYTDYLQYPLSVSTDTVRCAGGNSTKIELVSANTCKIMFVWDVDHKLMSPFSLLSRVNVPIIGSWRPRQILTLNLNQLKIIYRTAHQRGNSGKPSNVTVKMFTQTCRFAAHVTLNGQYAYEYFTPAVNGTGTDFHAASLGVETLANPKKGLVTPELNKLTYKIQGSYSQTLCEGANSDRYTRNIYEWTNQIALL